MDKREFEKQQKNLFQLIESWDANNIKLALQLIKKIPELKVVVEKRYLPIIQFAGGKPYKDSKPCLRNF